MKKIGLFTINDNNNYGNRLQNYAAQEYLKSLGFDVETVKNITQNSKKVKNKSLRQKLSTLSLGKIKRKLEAQKMKSRKFLSLSKQRLDNFELFTNTYTNESSFSISNDNIPDNLGTLYDYYVTGSDQVWNPNYRKALEIDFLTFAPAEKRVAFSPSFGISELPEEDRKNFSKWISEMTHLSVREDDGARIIKELTGRDSPVLVDPTLLLDKSDWLKIAKSASNINDEAFLLTYFLGGIPKEFKKQIKDLAHHKNLKIINLGDIKESESYVVGPSEFIDYVSKCSIFCTDSFHGAVFSILFEKPFVIYQRQGNLSMYSRINTLLSKFELENRKSENLSNNDEAFDIDYSHVPQILEKERKKVLDYLKVALELEIEEEPIGINELKTAAVSNV